jgi:2-keto-4-pentenoate hydratase/2-oxohepta-3-ene-1,7-dioic acid hydratase in catechol pathway
MKIVRFQYDHKISYGRLDGQTIRVYRNSPFDGPNGKDGPFKADVLTLKDVRLLAPCEPTKIVCLGLNYRSHAAEFQQKLPDLPLLFMKPPSAVVGPEDNIVLPSNPERIDYEGELGVVIGKTAKNVDEKDFSSYVLGYTCLNDVTDRIAQARDGQWTRAKGYDTFAPFGPCIETEISPGNLKIETLVNGETRQSGNTLDLIFDVPKLISFISGIMTLMPGDVIATGTPEGIGPLKAGDVIEIRIEGIGSLRNHVVASNEAGM